MAIPQPHERPHPEAPSPKEFFMAAHKGNLSKVSDWLDRGVVDPNTIRDAEGKTLLHHAATWGSRPVTGILLINRADPSIRDNEGKTPLHHSILTDDLQLQKALINDKTVNAKDNDGTTPLIGALRLEKTKLARELLGNRDIRVNMSDKDGMNALYYALALPSNRDVANEMFSRKEKLMGINKVYAKRDASGNVQRQRLLDFAAARGDEGLVRLLRSRGAKIRLSKYQARLGLPNPVQLALKKGHTRLAEQLNKWAFEDEQQLSQRVKRRRGEPATDKIPRAELEPPKLEKEAAATAKLQAPDLEQRMAKPRVSSMAVTRARVRQISEARAKWLKRAQSRRKMALDNIPGGDLGRYRRFRAQAARQKPR